MAKEWYIGGEVAELIDWTPFDDEESDDPLRANNKSKTQNKSASVLANNGERPKKKKTKNQLEIDRNDYKVRNKSKEHSSS